MLNPQLRRPWVGLAALVVLVLVGGSIIRSCSESSNVAHAKRSLYCIGLLSYAQSAASQRLAGSYNQTELLNAASKAARTLPPSKKSVEDNLRDVNAGRKYVPPGLTMDDVKEVDGRVRNWANMSGDRGGGAWNGRRIAGQAMDELDSCFFEFR